MSEEAAPGFLGNLSIYPDGIYVSAKQIEEYAKRSMITILNAKDVDAFFNDLPADDVSSQLKEVLVENDDNEMVDLELKEQMDKMEIEYGSSKSREMQKRQHSNKFKLFLKDQKCDTSFENLDEESLNHWLRKYYFSLRCKDGEPYKPGCILMCITRRATMSCTLRSDFFHYGYV